MNSFTLGDMIMRWPTILLIWVIAALYIAYRLYKEEVECKYCNSEISKQINNLVIGCMISIIFTFFFFVFGSGIATVLFESEPVIEKVYRLDPNDENDYYRYKVSTTNNKAKYEITYINDYDVIESKFIDTDDLQIKYMEDDTEDAYMEVLRYHYKISPIDETFFVLNMDLDDELIKTIYRLHIPKNTK